MKTTTAISRPGHVTLATMSTVGVTLTDQPSTLLILATTLADTSRMAGATTTQVTVHATIIQLMVSAIVDLIGTRRQLV